jgi:aerotaxis receptor
LVKNRRKDGDHYWVLANVTPIMRHGKPQGYMSVRIKPSRAQIQTAESLYQRMRAADGASPLPFYLAGGEVRYKGWRSLLGWAQRLTLTRKLFAALVLMSGLGMLPQLLNLQGWAMTGAQLASLTVGAALVLRWFDRSFGAAMEQAERFALDIAGCNLTTSVSSDFPPPLNSLIKSLRQIQVNLSAVVGDVRNEVQKFSQTATEVADGSMNLSERTESQASSLEETAASMEQLSSTVKQTAETAQQVAAQSADSTSVAATGSAAVHRVSEAMQAINASSGKMRDIIAVIEGIAFQTNILALNAAVEAARAGEQGRGFAVVASEVRALAQRSAAAAKEINQLIAQSAEQIAEGTQQMSSAGHTIDQVVQSVNMVGELIAQITNATREQALGISQVNEAVTQLDTVTQQNAALVEESAAAADGLKAGTLGLARSVQVFLLP